ncbi:MAG: ATP-binding protein, partial [Planctomycetaceae bacterium]
DNLDRIFEPFVRLKDPRTAHASGTGMGLNLVKTFVEAHGGHVTVESVPDQGSTFAIYLPLHPLETVQVPTTALTRIDLSALVGDSARR